VTSPSDGCAENTLDPVEQKVTEIITFGTRLLDRFVLLHASLLVASIPRYQPVARRSKIRFIGIISCTNVRGDWLGTGWNTLVAASDIVIVTRSQAVKRVNSI